MADKNRSSKRSTSQRHTRSGGSDSVRSVQLGDSAENVERLKRTGKASVPEGKDNRKGNDS